MPCGWDWPHELWDLNRSAGLSPSGGILHQKKDARNSSAGQRVVLHRVEKFAMLGVLCWQFSLCFI